MSLSETIIKDAVRENNKLLHSLALTIDGMRETLNNQSKLIRELKKKKE